MSDIMMSQTGFWVAFSIIFMIVSITWFFLKMVKLSKQDRVPLDDEE